MPGVHLGALYGDAAATTGLFAAHDSRVVVSVLCSGDGTIALGLAEEAPTVLTCERGGPALAMLESAGALEQFTISVDPDGPVRWSLAAGAVPPSD